MAKSDVILPKFPSSPSPSIKPGDKMRPAKAVKLPVNAKRGPVKK